MCGIAGFLSSRRDPGARTLLERMTRVLEHRGPDDSGHLLLESEGGHTPQVALGMRRLSIIDLATGRQPIASEDGRCHIVFNGEIYNHLPLRRELESLGHLFRTRSDTEVILHAYEQFGPDCVLRLRGMFGFAIWDARRERLLLARDPAGIKPLYWTETADRLLFASEIKALLRDPAVPRRLDAEALQHYLTFLYVPAPRTMFAGIRQLPPGHRLIWESGRVRVEEYWSGPESLLREQAGEPVTPEETWEVLRESVGAHMLSDVPLGAFLSGGLDSTLIVALMAELSRHPVQTFSIGFSGAGLYDEQAYARRVAEHLRTEHREFVVDADAVEVLPQILRHLDEPLADASVIPNFLLARMAREHVKVALTGIGGDELFGGYRRYFGDALARKWQRVPRAVRHGLLLPALRLVPPSGDTLLGDTSRLVQKFLEPLDLQPEARYLAWNAYFAGEARRRLCAGGPHAESLELLLPHFERARHRPFADRAMYVDLKTYLPGDPLFLSDRMTMAHSLEARVPFVDPQVMEFAARVPLSQKIRGRTTKLLLRQVLSGRVPREVIQRPKRGFGTPIDVWLRGGLARLFDRCLDPDLLRERGYFRPEYVAWLRGEQAAGRRDFSQHVWALLVFELWHRAYLDRDLSERADLTLADLDLGEGTAAGAGPVAPPHRSAGPSVRPVCRASSAAARPLSVLMVSDVDPVRVIGGAERILNEHSTRLAARGHRVVVLTRRADAGLPETEEFRGVRVVRHPVQGKGALSFARSVIREGGAAFARLLREEPFDLVNVHQPLAAYAALRRLESRSLPVLYTYLSPWSHEYRTRSRAGPRRAGGIGGNLNDALNSQARERIERAVLRRADWCMVLSRYSSSQLREVHGFGAGSCSVIPGGVDTGRFQPVGDRAALRRRLGLPDGPLLLTVRNLVARMGLDSLLAAMPRVLRAHPGCTLCIGGAGPLRGELEQQAASLGLNGAVRFLGFLPDEDLPAWYAAADLFVLPTRCLEGFGLVTVEALACGTPVAGTPIGATPEILGDLDLLFRGPEPDDLAELLVRRLPEIYGNEELRAACRRRAVERYGWDALIPRLEELLRGLAAGRRPE